MREEHYATRERRPTNGRPPRRPVHYGSPRPRKPPPGRIRRQLIRLVGLAATGLLLAVGVTVFLMVTRDNGTDPPETFAAADPTPAPTAAPKKAKRPRGPRLTPQQRASRDAAVTQLRSQGFEPVALSDYRPRQSLRVLIGRPKASTGVRGRRAFFFVREEYLGTDAAEPSLRVKVLRQREGLITLVYSLFSASDRACCPTAGTVRVRFTVADGRLIPQDPIPPVASRLPATAS
jgi:hypothetical protein